MKIVYYLLLFIIILALSGCSGTIMNTEPDAVLADALSIQVAAQKYCLQTTCTDNQELTWTELSDYYDGFSLDNYDTSYNNGIVAILLDGKWKIYMEKEGTGELEFTHGLTPSDEDRTKVVKDTNRKFNTFS